MYSMASESTEAVSVYIYKKTIISFHEIGIKIISMKSEIYYSRK